MRFTPANPDFDVDGFSDGEDADLEPQTCLHCGKGFDGGSSWCPGGACFMAWDKARKEQAEAKFQAEREANLQRWGLRPKGVNIEIRRVA